MSLLYITYSSTDVLPPQLLAYPHRISSSAYHIFIHITYSFIYFLHNDWPSLTGVGNRVHERLTVMSRPSVFTSKQPHFCRVNILPKHSEGACVCASETPRTSGGKGSWRRRNIRALRRRKRVRFMRRRSISFMREEYTMHKETEYTISRGEGA